MKTTGWLAVLAAIVSIEPLLAHHSLVNYDTTKAVRVKGTIVKLQKINPHSILFVDGEDAEGRMRRWAIEGPAIRQLQRAGFAADTLKPGDVVEVCGYLPKEPIVWQVASADGATSTAGRLINAEALVMPDGREQSWGDYGVHRCFAPGFRDQHSRP